MANALNTLLHEILEKTNLLKLFESRVSEALETDIENLKRSNNFIEIDKNKIVDRLMIITDDDLREAFQTRYKECNAKIERNKKRIKAIQAKLALLDKDIACFKAKVNAITADDILKNKYLFKSLAHRFIKRIEVGNDIMIEFYDF